MDSKHISIIITCFNQKKFVEEAINSCFDQNLPADWRKAIIVVDDGSTDQTPEILIKKFLLSPKDQTNIWQNENLILIKEKNHERGASRNIGAFFALNRFHSKWLSFLDGDDCYAPDTFIKFIDRLNTLGKVKNLSALYANGCLWFENNQLGQPLFKKPQREGDLKRYVLNHVTLSTGRNLISSQVFQNIKGFNENREMSGSEDWELCFRLSLQGPIFYSHHIAQLYRRHSDNTSGSRFETSIKKAMEEMNKVLQSMDSAHKNRDAKTLYSYGYSLISGSFNMDRQYSKALLYLLKALRKNPHYIFYWDFWRRLGSIIWRFLKSVFR